LLKILFSGELYRHDAKNLGGERVIDRNQQFSARVAYCCRLFEDRLGGVYLAPSSNISGRQGIGICVWARM
jgi:hypothetical protein